MRCRQCGAENMDEAMFCQECGNKLEKEIICPKCGVKNDIGYSFCQNCGTILNQQIQSQEQENPNEKLEECEENEIVSTKRVGFRKQKIFFGIAAFVVLIIAIVYLATRCKHEWIDASCIAPKTCSLCGKQKGDVLPHTWEEATCEHPKRCTVCGLTDGESLPHTWEEATCEHPKRCTVCGLTDGETLPHTWIEATCTAPKACNICGTTEGKALEHSFKTATCIDPAICRRCGYTTGTKDPSNHSLNAEGQCIWCGENYGLKLTSENYKRYVHISCKAAHNVEGGMYLADTREHSIYLVIDAVDSPMGADKDVVLNNVVLNADIKVKPSSPYTYHVQTPLTLGTSYKQIVKKISLEYADTFLLGEDRPDFQITPTFTGYALVYRHDSDQRYRVEN